LFESPANMSGHHHDHAGHTHGGSCCAHEHGDDANGHAHGAAPLAPAAANAVSQSHGKVQLPNAQKARDDGHEHDGCCGH
jgi:hypothetical protein